PESNGARKARKYAGLIFDVDNLGRGASSAAGFPASSYGSLTEPEAGNASDVATDSTPGMASRWARSRSKNETLSSGRGYLSAGRLTDPPSISVTLTPMSAVWILR